MKKIIIIVSLVCLFFLGGICGFSIAARIVKNSLNEEYIVNQRMIEDSRSAFDQLRRENEQYAEDVNNQLLNDQKASLDATLAEWEDTQVQIADLAARNADRVADGFERVVFAGFKDGAKGMKQAFKQVLQEMVIDLGRSALREALLSLFTEKGSGGSGASGGSSIFSTIASAVGSFFGGGSSGGEVAGGANGLSFTVPGPTSGDHVVPIFRANGGEQVTVTPRGQTQGGGGEGVSVTYNIDARGADPASEARMRNAIRESEQRTIAVITDKVRRRRL